MPEPRKNPITLVSTYPTGAPINYVNASRFSHLGPEVFFDLGVIDEQELIQALAKGDQPGASVNTYVQYRFVMNIAALQMLKSNIDEIMAMMRKNGAISE